MIVALAIAWLIVGKGDDNLTWNVYSPGGKLFRLIDC